MIVVTVQVHDVSPDPKIPTAHIRTVILEGAEVTFGLKLTPDGNEEFSVLAQGQSGRDPFTGPEPAAQ